MTPADRIRALADGDGPLVLPGVYDGLSARLAAQAGFRALVVSGYSVAASRLGMPDFGYLTQTEITDAARDLVAAVPGVPVIVDADTGYGNALSAARTARLLHQAGAAGMILEDQQWPKRCGHMDGKRIVDRGEWLAKIRAVVDLRDEGIDLFLIARTDARGLEGLDEANPRRVTRALERCLATGRPWVELRAEFARQPGPFADHVVRLTRLEREPGELQERIGRRVEAMLAAGLVEEVRGLRARGLEANPSAARAIGYREVLECLDGRLPPGELAAAIARDTRALVKKQRTWFRTQLPPHRVVAAAALRDPAELFPPI